MCTISYSNSAIVPKDLGNLDFVNKQLAMTHRCPVTCATIVRKRFGWTAVCWSAVPTRPPLLA